MRPCTLLYACRVRDLDYVHFSSGPRSEPVRAISSGPRSEPVREIAEFTVDPGKSRCVR